MSRKLREVGLYVGGQDFVLRGPENRDAEGVERRGELGGGIPLPSRLGGLGSVVSSPAGSGAEPPAENGFWCILSLTKRIW